MASASFISFLLFFIFHCKSVFRQLGLQLFCRLTFSTGVNTLLRENACLLHDLTVCYRRLSRLRHVTCDLLSPISCDVCTQQLDQVCQTQFLEGRSPAEFSSVENSVLLKCRKLRREDQETSDSIVSRISLFYDMCCYLQSSKISS